MSFHRINRQTCLIINPKCALMSMREAIGDLAYIEITGEEALTYKNRLMFIRHPIERINSLFNHFYAMTTDNIMYSEFMPHGIIRAETGKQNEDYQRFIDYILGGGCDDHWCPQVDLASYEGQFIPNIVHTLDTLSERWTEYIGNIIGHENSWPEISRNEYRHDELLAHYSQDLQLWEAVNNGTWQPN